MADNKQTIVIKKVKGGGHAAPHGGAWKVAFADFMTAMMAFFLVMWLMGSDEEIQSEVAEYFNNPASAWRPDLASKTTVPLGERTGSGDNVLSGLAGMAPEDLIDRPSREFKQSIDAQDEAPGEVQQTKPGLRPPVKMEIEVLKFSIPEYHLFKPGTDELTEKAEKYLANLSKLVKGFKGKLTIKGFTEPPPSADAAVTDPYEFAISRAVAVQQHLVRKRIIVEPRVHAIVSDKGRDPATTVDESRRLQFIFK